MKNKGLILFFTILIALVCLYCLSFSFASWRVENKAAKFANDPTAIAEVKKAANGDVMLEKHLVDSLIDARTRKYLTGMNDSTVYLGNTYKQCKYKELNLGLERDVGDFHARRCEELSHQHRRPTVQKRIRESTDGICQHGER